MIRDRDKRIQDLLDYYEEESLKWLRKTIVEVKLTIENLEKERLVKRQKSENKRLAREKRVKNKKLSNERKKKNKQLRQNIKLNKIKNEKLKRLNNIRSNKVKYDISLNIKISNKGLFPMIEINQEEKMRFYIDDNKIKNLGFSPSVNKLACKFFSYCNEFDNRDGQYAENGGERRVWYTRNRFFKLDYIDDKDKIILEWNESCHYHSNGVIRKENLIRKERVLFYYPNYKYIMIKEDDYFPDGRRIKNCIRIQIFEEIREFINEINENLKIF